MTDSAIWHRRNEHPDRGGRSELSPRGLAAHHLRRNTPDAIVEQPLAGQQSPPREHAPKLNVERSSASPIELRAGEQAQERSPELPGVRRGTPVIESRA